MRQPPLISIVTPSFNQGRFIEDTIRSIVEQDYPHVEYIIMDGGSSDETVSVIRRYEQHIAYWVSERDRGQSDALKRGFARATGDILAWVNSDDALAPGALSAVAAAFAGHQGSEKPDIVAGIVNVWQGDALVYRHRTGYPPGLLRPERIVDLEKEWLTGRFFYQPEVFFSRSIYERAGGTIDDALHYSMDYDLWLRCARAGARILPIDVELANFRLHPDQKTSSTETYLPELTRHANAARTSLGLPAIESPTSVGGGRPLRVGMLNDFGFQYGAGRAHGRMAACLAAAGAEVAVFRFREGLHDSQARSLADAVSALKGADVDVVLVGNLHGAFPEGVDLSPLAEIAPMLIVAHDFFWLTGRCPYPLGCDGYVFGCEPSCPTREEYPRIPFGQIPVAYAGKRAVLAHPDIRLLANSGYTETIARRALAVAMPDLDLDDTIRRINLPVPEQAYRPQGRDEARRALAIDEDTLVVLTASTSVTDARKGFRHILEACRLVGDTRLRLFAMGHVGKNERVEGVDYLGNLDDEESIAQAFRAADVFMSATADETFGQTLVEAALCGCPSIAYEVGAVPEVVLPGVTGWLVARNDVAGLADVLRTLLRQDRADREAMRVSAHRHAAARHRAPSFLAGMNDILRMVVPDPGIQVPTGVQFDGSRARPISFLQARRAVFEAGVDPWEGPYPEHQVHRKVAWQTAPRADLVLYATRAGPHRLTLEFANALRPQSVSLRREGDELLRVSVEPEGWDVTHELSVFLDLPLGETRLSLDAPEAFDAGDRLLHIAFVHLALDETTTASGAAEIRRLVAEAAGTDPAPDPHSDDTAGIEADPQGPTLRPGLILREGFAPIEGPYDEIGVPMRLAWQVDDTARIAVFVGEPQATVALDVYLPCDQDIAIRSAGRRLDLHAQPNGAWTEPTRLDLPLAGLDPGWHDVDITCTNVLVDDVGRKLRLAVLASVEESGPAAAAPTDRESA